MGKAQIKVEGGKLVKVQLESEGDRIREVRITGDFFLHPEEMIDDLEKTLKGSKLDEDALADCVKAFIKKHEAVLLGVAPGDFAKCIVMAGESSG